jgi:hypothetical protein
MFSNAAQAAAGFLPSLPNLFGFQVQNFLLVLQEPSWQWWMKVLAPWLGPLLSTIGSIYVAWNVFSWQKKRDREQWARDHRKAEWRELLADLATVRRDFFRPYVNEDIAYSFVANLDELKHRLNNVASSAIFIAEVVNEKGLRSRLDMFLVELSKTAERISLVSVQKSPFREERLEGAYRSIFSVYDKIVNRTRAIAEEDLGVKKRNTNPNAFLNPEYLDTFDTSDS